MNPKLFRFLLARYVRRVVRQCWLESHFTAAELDALLKDVWADYLSKAGSIPQQANLGNAIMMHFSALSLSTVTQLCQQGIDRREAVQMVAQVTQHITYRWAKRGKVLLSPLFPDRLNRLHAGMQVVMHTLFSRPGYQFAVERFEDGFRLNVYQCPVAEWMTQQGIPALCVQAYCGVDPGVVARMDGKLTRTGTLAMGAERCDFVFHVAEDSLAGF